jgi:hypothetical protein
MKLAFAIVTLAALLYVLPASAETVYYTLSVVNVEGAGDLSWTIANDGFIGPPDPIFDSQRNCISGCNPGTFTSFVAVSEPSQGEGCQITSVWLQPSYGTVTFFSPLCQGKYDAMVAGDVPQPGQFGTWSFQGTNPDGTQDFVSLTVSDPPSDPVGTPEPGTWGLLLGGLALLLGQFLKRGCYRNA